MRTTASKKSKASKASSKKSSKKSVKKEAEKPPKGKRFREYQHVNWSQKLLEVKQFVADHGHCKIPHLYPANKALAHCKYTFCYRDLKKDMTYIPTLSTYLFEIFLFLGAKRQRYQYNCLVEGKPSALTPERVHELEKYGFCWDLQEAGWNENFEELVRFAWIHGHANVPSGWTQNPSLGKIFHSISRKHYILWKSSDAVSLCANQKP